MVTLRSSLLACALTATAVSNAQLFVNNPLINVTSPGTYYFTGSATSLFLDRFIFADASTLFQGPLDTGPSLTPSITPGFQAFISQSLALQSSGSDERLDFSGRLFSVQITPTTPLGRYFQNSNVSSDRSYIAYGSETNFNGILNTSITVEAVPEPGTYAVLGFSAVAVLRRRRRA